MADATRRHGCHRKRELRSSSAFRLAGMHASRAGRASSRTRQGGHPGRNGGEHRPAQSRLSVASQFPGETRPFRGLEQIQPRLLDDELSRLRGASSSATSIPIRIRPSKSRTASVGQTKPPAPRWRRSSRPGRSCRPSTSARQCTARSAVRCWSSTATTTISSTYARAQTVAEVTGAELVIIAGGGHNPLGRIPAKCNTLITDFLDRRLGIVAPAKRTNRIAAKAQACALSLLPDRIGSRAARHRHHARTAQAACRTWRSTGWRKIR